MGPRIGQGAVSKTKLHVEVKFDIQRTMHHDIFL